MVDRSLPENSLCFFALMNFLEFWVWRAARWAAASLRGPEALFAPLRAHAARGPWCFLRDRLADDWVTGWAFAMAAKWLSWLILTERAGGWEGLREGGVRAACARNGAGNYPPREATQRPSGPPPERSPPALEQEITRRAKRRRGPAGRHESEAPRIGTESHPPQPTPQHKQQRGYATSSRLQNFCVVS